MGIKKIARRRRGPADAPPVQISASPSPAPATSTGKSDWLPEGWKTELRKRNNSNRVDRYYICPVSGKIFRSKLEVLRHLAANVGDDKSSEDQVHLAANGGEVKSSEDQVHLAANGGEVKSSEDQVCKSPLSARHNLYPSGRKFVGHGRLHLLAVLEEYPLEWLPSGWIVEFGTWMNEESTEDNYKCYYDPITESRFYSKEEVVSYLEASINPTTNDGGSDNEKPANISSSSRKENIDSPRNIFAQFDFSPSGLPQGWIKEIRFTRAATSERRDPYYIDTATGFVFRSTKDALASIESRVNFRYLYRLEESQLPKAHCLNKAPIRPLAVRKPNMKKTANHPMRKCEPFMLDADHASTHN